MEAPRKRIPRNPEDDYTREAAESRQAFIAETTGAQLEQPNASRRSAEQWVHAHDLHGRNRP